MATRLNNEFCIAMDHKDLQANAMAVDNTGNYVLLAGRRYIAIKDLDDECEQFRKFPRQSKYEVGSAEWNPTEHHGDLCVISSNQRLQVLRWSLGELTQEHSLRAHTRVITGVNWHPSEPTILASCSADTFIQLWDIRDPRRPSVSLSAMAEASRVRWNNVNSHLLATAHDGDIKLWDKRNGTAPVQYISAHLSKIHGLEWSPNSETHLTTSSQDCTVKFWDTSNTRRAESVLSTNAPVWRARFTPFGNGLITVVVPQLRRGENGLLLWNIDNRGSPVHTFVGHRDVVLDFGWRKRPPRSTNFELVTWSKDQTLLIWQIDAFLQKLCGHEPIEGDGEDVVEDITKASSPKVRLLEQEYSLLNVHIPNLEVTEMDIEQRTCTVKVDSNSGVVIVQVDFPNSYPHGVPPTFQLMDGTTIEKSLVNQLVPTLNRVAQQRVIKNRTCLEPCLRQLVATLEQYNSEPYDIKNQYDVRFIEVPSAYGLTQDAYIPFPRTCGVKFCSVSLLVAFGKSVSRRPSSKIEITATPRALSALCNFSVKRSGQLNLVSSYYYKNLRRNPAGVKVIKAYVSVFDMAGHFSISHTLAEKYLLNGDPVSVCTHNLELARKAGRRELAQTWALAQTAAAPELADDGEFSFWESHPFGKKMINDLIRHYASIHDFQMAAMLCCIFENHPRRSTARKPSLKQTLPPALLAAGKKWFKSGGSPYHTIPLAETIAEGLGFPLVKTTRSSSLDNLRVEEIQETPPQRVPGSNLSEYYKVKYAELLYRWRLLYNRAEILKFVSTPMETYRGIDFLTDCQHCGMPSRHCSCGNCKKLTLNCAICHISVRGSTNCCIICGHGGHTLHMFQWFRQNKMCPSGCGCYCLAETAQVFD